MVRFDYNNKIEIRLRKTENFEKEHLKFWGAQRGRNRDFLENKTEIQISFFLKPWWVFHPFSAFFSAWNKSLHCASLIVNPLFSLLCAWFLRRESEEIWGIWWKQGHGFKIVWFRDYFEKPWRVHGAGMKSNKGILEKKSIF